MFLPVISNCQVASPEASIEFRILGKWLTAWVRKYITTENTENTKNTKNTEILRGFSLVISVRSVVKSFYEPTKLATLHIRENHGFEQKLKNLARNLLLLARMPNNLANLTQIR